MGVIVLNIQDFKSKIFCGVLLIFVLFLAGCCQNINLSTYADYDVLSYGFKNGDTFAIKGLGENNFLDKEIQKKIAFVLKNRGYQVVKRNEYHKYLITFDCDMNSEIRTEYEEKIVESTTVSVLGSIINSCRNGSNSSSASGNAVTTHKQMVPVDVTYYNKYLQLSVYKIDGVCNKAIWTAKANLFDKNYDLRYASNYLLAAALDYFGKNTHKTISVAIGNNEKCVQEVRDFIAPKKRKKKNK